MPSSRHPAAAIIPAVAPNAGVATRLLAVSVYAWPRRRGLDCLWHLGLYLLCCGLKVASKHRGATLSCMGPQSIDQGPIQLQLSSLAETPWTHIRPTGLRRRWWRGLKLIPALPSHFLAGSVKCISPAAANAAGVAEPNSSWDSPAGMVAMLTASGALHPRRARSKPACLLLICLPQRHLAASRLDTPRYSFQKVSAAIRV